MTRLSLVKHPLVVRPSFFGGCSNRSNRCIRIRRLRLNRFLPGIVSRDEDASEKDLVS